MADSAKREKLAAAKKKLKKFQTKKTPSNSPAPTNRNRTPDSDTNIVKKNVNSTPGSTGHSPQVNGPLLNSIPHTPVSPGVNHNDASRPPSTYSTPVGNATGLPPNERITESTERLQHLSRQINGLITESNAYMNNSPEVNNTADTSNSDLELRNQQLASFLEQHSRANEQLNKQLEDLKLQNSKLHQNLDSERKGFEDKLRRELGSLKEQLQVHIQTIGILVAEKTELQSSLNQSTKLQEQKSEELEELQGRLKASRQRVSELERSYTNASSSNQKHEQLSKDYSKEVDRLKLELYKLNKSNEEFQQQNSEIQGKLQKKGSECSKLEDSIIELKGQLEMTQLHLQQLQNGTQPTIEDTQKIDQLVTERGELQAKIEQYEELFQKVTVERDQYQGYIDQLNNQTHHLQLQIGSLNEEKAQLARKSRELENIIDDLKTKQDSVAMGTVQAEQDKSLLEHSIAEITNELEQYRQQYQAQVSDNSQLSRLISEKEEKIMELEMSVQRLDDSQVDSEQLLANMQSDKTALSRAIAQNKELKNQLAELQNGFVKMSNDNMDLMTTVQTEQHTAKELAARLGQQEEELKELREELIQKERFLHELSERTHHDSESHSMTTEQIETRLKEFQEHSPLLESMQRELASAQDTINALTNQNSELRAQMLRESSNASMDSEGNTSQVESLSASIRQLEGERDQVLEQLKSEQDDRQSVISKLEHLQQELATQTPATLNGDIISKAQFEALQHAMQQLEGKFSKAMRDKADLMDKSEQLEHIIMQLQGETDTIGEYVALYQTQRSILKQRTMEKDTYISSMARERQEMQDKLAQLQALVMQLLGERQMLHSYHDSNSNISMVTPKEAQQQQQHQQQEATPGKTKSNKPFGSNLDSSHLEDWPDYSSDSDTDTSEVEPIIGGQGDASGKPSHAPDRTSPAHSTPLSGQGQAEQQPATLDISQQWNIPSPNEDQTAQRIMHLLTEIGTSNLVDRSFIEDRNFIHCNHCTGQLLNV